MTYEPNAAQYWQNYYANIAPRNIPALPSQFAVFAAGETSNHSIVVDIGCGDGRDSFFFAQHGHKVIGIDAASTAVASCYAATHSKNLGASFVCSDICDSSFLDLLHSQMQLMPLSAVVVYSRFFLHAVSEAGQSAIWALTQALSKRASTKLMVEFRTKRDIALPKQAPNHFRRFIDPLELIAQGAQYGFKPDYFVEGFGFAKHGLEDAHVARCIFSV